MAVGIFPHVVVPGHILDEKRPLAVTPIGFLGKRVQHDTRLLQNALDGDFLVEGAPRIRVRLGQDAVIPSSTFDRALKRPGTGETRATLHFNPPIEALNDLGGLVIGVLGHRMNLNPQLRGPFRVQRELNGLVEARNRQHRPLRERHPADNLRLALLFHVIRPCQRGHLKPERVDFPSPLLFIRLHPDPKAVEGAGHFGRRHASSYIPIQPASVAGVTRTCTAVGVRGG